MSSPASDASRDAIYDWPPELLALLVETVPRLVRSKRAQIDLYRGCGVPESVLRPVEKVLHADRDSINRYEIARRVLVPLLDGGDRFIAMRREIVRRVVYFETFSNCWPNEAMEARGLVAQVRDVVQKSDAFTRMREEAESLKAERRREALAKVEAAAAVRKVRAEARDALFAVFAITTDPWKRGKALEGALNQVFAAWGILIEEDFTLRGEEGEGIVEQIDGVLRVDGPCLVEVKWIAGGVGAGDSAQHLVRVHHRPQTRGLLISGEGGFSSGVEAYHRDALVKGAVVALCELEEIVKLVQQEDADVEKFLRAKFDRATIRREPFFRPLG